MVAIPDQMACLGVDVEMPWTFYTATMYQRIAWSFLNKSSNENVMMASSTIFQRIVVADPYKDRVKFLAKSRAGIVLKKVTFADEGMYVCQVIWSDSNVIPNVTNTFQLTVVSNTGMWSVLVPKND